MFTQYLPVLRNILFKHILYLKKRFQELFGM
jgi:hypothetical protein